MKTLATANIVATTQAAVQQFLGKADRAQMSSQGLAFSSDAIKPILVKLKLLLMLLGRCLSILRL